MNDHSCVILRQAAQNWVAPAVPEKIPQGDMPGDKIQIEESHIAKCGVLFPALAPMLADVIEQSSHSRVVVAVCGGSGVGKSETASLLTFYLSQLGIGSYTMSGDNYPHRIPKYNDAERLSIFRAGGTRGLVACGVYSKENADILRTLQEEDLDADPAQAVRYPFLAVYQREGRKSLSGYLGSEKELNFSEVSGILSQFKNGADHIWLKRMGRTETELYYDLVDFTGVQVLILEWTHGNNAGFSGVDVPVLLNSTPEDTRAHRRSRNRDGKVDSPFTTMVLELEQKLLDSQADRAKLILSKSGQLLSYREYRDLMAGQM